MLRDAMRFELKVRNAQYERSFNDVSRTKATGNGISWLGPHH